jgi:malic enzyme
MLDSGGLLRGPTESGDPHKREFAWTDEDLADHGLNGSSPLDLLAVVNAVRPTILVGTTGRADVFDEAVIRTMVRHVERPIILPLSNPTSKSECDPAKALLWTDGRAVVATGSPFPPVEFGGQTHWIGQANNVYIFPGLGLGAIVSEAHEVTDSMFLVAARALADRVTAEDLAAGRIFPDLSELRSVSRAIATAVIGEARRLDLGRQIPDPLVPSLLEAMIWYPDYPPSEPVA